MRGAGGWHVGEEALRAGSFSITREEFVEKFAAFLYLRFHGTTGKYAGEYGPDGLRPWSLLARSALARGLAVHAYFNNTMGGDAVRDAARFEEMVGSRSGLAVRPVRNRGPSDWLRASSRTHRRDHR